MNQLSNEISKAMISSKTVWAQFVVIVINALIVWRLPHYKDFITQNAQYVVMMQSLVFIGVCCVNLFLRSVTKCRIGSVLLLALMLGGCAGIPQKLDTNIYYRRDLPFCTEGYGCFEGMTTLPKQSSYTFDIAPKGDANIDLLIVTTCHRNTSFERTSSGWFIFQKKNRFRYVYTPNPLIEGDGDCTLVFQTYEKDLGRHQWAVILFEHPKYTLNYTLYCDGNTEQVNGVGGCQSKEGLRQGVSFKERVMIEPDKNCPVPFRGDKAIYEFPVGYKQCGYTFRSIDTNKLGTLFTSGFRGELVREVK